MLLQEQNERSQEGSITPSCPLMIILVTTFILFWVMEWHVCMLYFLITSIMQTRMQEAFIIIFIFTFNIAMKKTWLFSNEVLCKCVWERGVPQSHDCHWQIKWLYNNIVYSSIPCTTSHNDFVFQFCSHTSSSNQHWIALMISSCQLLGTSTQTLKKNLTSNFLLSVITQCPSMI